MCIRDRACWANGSLLWDSLAQRSCLSDFHCRGSRPRDGCRQGWSPLPEQDRVRPYEDPLAKTIGPAARGTQSVVRASQASDQNPSAGPTNAHGSDWTMKMPSVSVTGSTQNRVPQEPAQPYVPADPGIIGAGGSTLTPTPRPYPSPSET